MMIDAVDNYFEKYNVCTLGWWQNMKGLFDLDKKRGTVDFSSTLRSHSLLSTSL
jgi:hypothetical protein